MLAEHFPPAHRLHTGLEFWSQKKLVVVRIEFEPPNQKYSGHYFAFEHSGTISISTGPTWSASVVNGNVTFTFDDVSLNNAKGIIKRKRDVPKITELGEDVELVTFLYDALDEMIERDVMTKLKSLGIVDKSAISKVIKSRISEWKLKLYVVRGNGGGVDGLALKNNQNSAEPWKPWTVSLISAAPRYFDELQEIEDELDVSFTKVDEANVFSTAGIAATWSFYYGGHLMRWKLMSLGINDKLIRDIVSLWKLYILQRNGGEVVGFALDLDSGTTHTWALSQTNVGYFTLTREKFDEKLKDLEATKVPHDDNEPLPHRVVGDVAWARKNAGLVMVLKLGLAKQRMVEFIDT